MAALDDHTRNPAPELGVAPPVGEAALQPPSFHKVPFEASCPHCRGEVTGSDGRATSADWAFVDAAYCISLSERPDRTALAAAEFHRIGLCQRVLFHRPRRHPHQVIAGIWEAHRTVALHALARGAETALILEDDVLFTRRVTSRRLARVRRAMAGLPAGWSIFFLGHWPLRARFVVADVLATRSACAHAYVASATL